MGRLGHAAVSTLCLGGILCRMSADGCWVGMGWNRRLPLSDQEVGFVFEELHRSKSSLPPYESLTRPTLVRWNLGEPLTVANCVVMSPQDVSTFEIWFKVLFRMFTLE